MPKQRLHIVIRGAVQGVGFRPFIYRLATGMHLPGWVVNSSQGVIIEVEGKKPHLDEFLLRIEREKPPHSFIQSLEPSLLDPAGLTEFEIRVSDDRGTPITIVMADIATCPECLHEISDPENRRYRYPFTNCTHCGPRYTIIESLPYDRPSTTMRHFAMCDRCRKEYDDPLDRRFHAQPNACPECGPGLELWDSGGNSIATHDEALKAAAEAIRSGKIAAVKGLGGFHLIVDARNDDAVLALRTRKHREEKPFAVMLPSIGFAKELCEISMLEERLLLSSESPIVLAGKKNIGHDLHRSFSESPLSYAIAPGNPYLGIMLPYTPLHHLLMRELGFPIVATSGNFSDEPICIDEHEALERLSRHRQVADVFLVHNRSIVHHVDDSIVRVMAGREMVLRRARGYAPLPIHLHSPEVPSMIAVGAHLKNTVAITAGSNVFISQHIGDLETEEALAAFRNVVTSLQSLYSLRPSTVVCDEHPDYLSTKEAGSMGMEVVAVQHHYAHIASCMAENELDGEVLGVSWDGTGYGSDGTIWGGEFLLTNETGFKRVATFRQFPLPGGDRAVREPRRTALGMLYAKTGDEIFDRQNVRCLKSFSEYELSVIRTMLRNNINSPMTSSVGRLFDGVASLIGLRDQTNFEGETAMELEFAATGHSTDERYPFQLTRTEIPFSIEWFPIVDGIMSDCARGIDKGILAAKFHNTLTEIIIAVSQQIRQPRIVLSGGCFQNKYLTERTIRRLEEEGFKQYWHQRVPPNDGGISLGQIAAAIRLKGENRKNR